MWGFLPCLRPAGACYNGAFPGRVAACPKKLEMIRMRALYKDAVNETRIVDVTTEALTAVMSGGQGLLWVDLMGDGGSAIENLLQQTFGFHPLAIDDALHETHIPKVDDWDTYLYLVFQDVAYDAAQRTILLPELDVFLGRGFWSPITSRPSPPLIRCGRRVSATRAGCSTGRIICSTG